MVGARAPTVEECVSQLEKGLCSLDSSNQIAQGLKMYKFTLIEFAGWKVPEPADCDIKSVEDMPESAIGSYYGYNWWNTWRYTLLPSDGSGEWGNGQVQSCFIHGIPGGEGRPCLYDVFSGWQDNGCDLETQHKKTTIWGAPVLSLVPTILSSDSGWVEAATGWSSYDRWMGYKSGMEGFSFDLADQPDGWYTLVEQGDDISLCDDDKFVRTFRRGTANGVRHMFFEGENNLNHINGTLFKIKCEEVDIDWCIVNVAEQLKLKKDDIPLDIRIISDNPQSGFLLALSNIHGKSCGERWQKVCKKSNTFKEICGDVYAPPYKCNRTVARDTLTVISLSWGAVQLVMAAMLAILGFLLGKICGSSNLDKTESSPDLQA